MPCMVLAGQEAIQARLLCPVYEEMKRLVTSKTHLFRLVIPDHLLLIQTEMSVVLSLLASVANADPPVVKICMITPAS